MFLFRACMRGEGFPLSYFSSLLLSPCLLPALMQSMFLFHQNSPPRQRRPRRRRIVVAGPHGAARVYQVLLLLHPSSRRVR